MLACFRYVIQLKEITLHKLFSAYLLEVRIAMAQFCRQLTHGYGNFGQIALEKPM
jgi:hypothetical protein